MNTNVLVTINGIQHEIDANDNIQTVHKGKYRLVSNKHIIKYTEAIDENKANPQNAITNLLKIDHLADTVTLTKKGISCTDMVFKKGVNHKGIYKTPFGNMPISIYTNNLIIKQDHSSIDVSISYSLEINYNHISDCTITINVQSL